MNSDTEPYVVLITGSRTWDKDVEIEIDLGNLSEVFGKKLIVRHGRCRDGADNIAKEVCLDLNIAQDPMPADWSLGKRAGFVRNYEMVNKYPQPSLCIAYIHNESNGATMCAELADKEGIYVLRRVLND